MKFSPFPYPSRSGASLRAAIERVGEIAAYDAEGVRALDAVYHAGHGVQHVMVLVVIKLEELRHDLGIRIGYELYALFLERFLYFEIVLDYAVVDQRDAPVLADVRMGVYIGGLAVRRPARMAYAHPALDVLSAFRQLIEHLEPALRLRHLQSAVRRNADAGGVVAAVLEPGQALQQNGRGLFLANIAYDTTHRIKVPPV
jgi:hypothetical protein